VIDGSTGAGGATAQQYPTAIGPYNATLSDDISPDGRTAPPSTWR